ncbi:MAG: PAS domain S-box protein [Chloroflexota bacterium]
MAASVGRKQIARTSAHVLVGLLLACAVAVLIPAAAGNWQVALLLLGPAAGLVFGITTISRERWRAVTELHDTTEALADSEARYDVLFTESPIIQLLVDPADGRIVDASRAAAAFYGWSADELRELTLADLEATTRGGRRAVLRRGGGIEHLHLVRQHRLAGGSVRTVEVQTGPVSLHGRRLDISTVRDITTEVEARRQVARLAAVVESSTEAIITADLDGTVTG